MRILLCGLAFLALSGSATAGQVSQNDLLGQMIELRWLAFPDREPFTAAQASSYDRKSLKPGNEDWFANGDYGQYVRVEQTSGRTEYVMADLKGPGVVTRIWSANPMGTIRFYVNGESKPRIEQKMVDILSGNVAPMADPYGYKAAHGFDLYYPLPYQNSLKITVEPASGQNAGGLYYHIGYRTYGPGTTLQGVQPNSMEVASTVAKFLIEGLPAVPETKYALKPVASGASYDSGSVKASGLITSLRFHIPFPLVQTFRAMVWGDPHTSEMVLQNLILEIDFDGETTVRAPLGSFFADSPGLNPYRSLPMQVSKDGTFTCRWPMPVLREFRVRVKNVGPVEVPIAVDWTVDSRSNPADAYRFHAQWDGTRGHTRPLRDMRMLDVKGEGRFVGVSLHVANPTQKWWGEGDEKIWVDDETFPSAFGTGTEDYFGYAWSSNELFDHPYNGQVRSDGPINYGHSAIHRWHILDCIPFKRHFQFDMEMWHWGDVVATYDWTAYWYARPGGTGNHALPMQLRLPEELVPPLPVKGAIEGEKLPYTMTGGKVEVQNGFEQLSGGAQLWWTYPAEHDKLTIRVQVPKTGRYDVVACLGHAVDYGIHRITFAGKPAGTIDCFIPAGVEWTPKKLGSFDLPAGEVVMEVECLGHNAGAKPANMFGLDYLLLKPH